MDANTKDSKPLETKETAINDENTSFILGNENLITPQKHAADANPNPCTPDSFQTPLDFSRVTVAQLGITPEIFVKNSLGKSSSYFKKSRRRSTVGVRGSPETNNLIRFIARQRNLKNAKKSPLTQNFPFPGSPVLYQNVNSLRERISAFQSAFHSIKETGRTADCPEFPEAEGEFETMGLPKKEGLGECQQSAFPAQLPKRQKVSVWGSSDGNLTNAIDFQTFSIATPPSTDRACAVGTSVADFSEKSSEPGLPWKEFLPLSELKEASAGVKVTDCVEGKGLSDAVSLVASAEVSSDAAETSAPGTPLCSRGLPAPEISVLRSVLKKPSVMLCLEGLQVQEDCNNHCDSGTHPSLISTLANCCREQKAENYKVTTFVNMRKRKRVTFGEDLSPEVFDESLPANTPLRRGGTPVCKADSSSDSLLPMEWSLGPEYLPQPDFDEKGENLENIEPLPVSYAVISPLSTDTFSSSNNNERIPSCKAGRRTRASNRKSKPMSSAEESVCSLITAAAQPCKEKKTQRRRSQESKCKDRVPLKKTPVLKSCRKKKAKRKKGVQNVYGERDIASKKPLLSPIPELPEVSERSPLVPSIHRTCSVDFSANGELEEMKLPRRKNAFPQNSEVLHINQELSKDDVSEFCSSYTTSSFSLINATLEQDSNRNTVGIHSDKIIPKAEMRLESENDLKTGTKNENSPISCASVTGEPVLSDGLLSDFMTQSQDFSAAGQNMENLSQRFKISGGKKCEQDDFLVTAGERLQATRLMSGLQKECDCSEGVLTDGIKEEKSQSEDLGGSGSGLSCGGKHGRSPMCRSDGQSSHLGHQGVHQLSYSAIEISLENSELYKDLSDSLEQSFQRTNRETKVRRSTRLQKYLENEGLVWISLPLPPASGPSQRTKRRTMHTCDSRGFESMSPREKTVSFRQKQCVPYSTAHQESRVGSAASSGLPGKRRRSFCTSALVNTKATKSKC
ncbi:cell division cycle-associated protein 2 isoform X2 [Saccopteryx leptura]|uniref:cell division cycle-associated protein 2 isoform X2 n=1 Tax=Saccopteryx leptura TaxID=249018 RepID=UPI00339BF340